MELVRTYSLIPPGKEAEQQDWKYNFRGKKTKQNIKLCFPQYKEKTLSVLFLPKLILITCSQSYPSFLKSCQVALLVSKIPLPSSCVLTMKQVFPIYCFCACLISPEEASNLGYVPRYNICFCQCSIQNLNDFDFPFTISSTTLSFLKMEILQNKDNFFFLFRNTYDKAESPAFFAYVLFVFINLVLYSNLSLELSNSFFLLVI